MAEQEGGAFVCSNVTSRPRGFLSYVTVVNSAWVPGKLGIIVTGAFPLHVCVNGSPVWEFCRGD
ncbi:hypothetical protein MKK67_29150 [Methylobacterium sp. J-072]|uniref:hypothetical protein n=1 Tax=Methylobacterium sp. J-072 TaxID=2836651 RepID=UPI001FB8EEEE|nr:hypothetical protein [Methylobacterium sp. J-072]MCJ2096543.1 hypothetical protein [Methylobacterium sp. J-072]